MRGADMMTRCVLSIKSNTLNSRCAPKITLYIHKLSRVMRVAYRSLSPCSEMLVLRAVYLCMFLYRRVMRGMSNRAEDSSEMCVARDFFEGSE